MKNKHVAQFLQHPLEHGPLDGDGADHEDTRGQLTPGMFLRQLTQQLASAASDAHQQLHASSAKNHKLEEAAHELDYHAEELRRLTVALDSASQGQMGFVAQNEMRRGQDIMRGARYVLRKHRRTIEEAKQRRPSSSSEQQQQYLEDATRWVTDIGDVSVVLDAYYEGKDISNEQLSELVDPGTQEPTLFDFLPARAKPLIEQQRRNYRIQRMQKALQDLRSGHLTPAQLYHHFVSNVPGALPPGMAQGLSFSNLRNVSHHLEHDLEQCHSHDDHKAAHDYIRTHVLPAVREARDKLRETRITKAERTDEDTPNHHTHDHLDHHLEHILTQVEAHFENLLQGLGIGQPQGMVPGMVPGRRV